MFQTLRGHAHKEGPQQHLDDTEFGLFRLITTRLFLGVVLALLKLKPAL
jgi:hypothetical protein